MLADAGRYLDLTAVAGAAIGTSIGVALPDVKAWVHTGLAVPRIDRGPGRLGVGGCLGHPGFDCGNPRPLAGATSPIAVSVADHGNSPPSIIETPQVSTRAGRTSALRLDGVITPFRRCSARAWWARIRSLSPSMLNTTERWSSRCDDMTCAVGKECGPDNPAIYPVK